MKPLFKSFKKEKGLVVVPALLLISLAVMVGGFFLMENLAEAFTGPSQGAGIGSGAIGVNDVGNLSIGATTPLAETKLYILASSTNVNEFVLKIYNPSSTGAQPVFVVRNDGHIGIATSTPDQAVLQVQGDIYVGGNINVSGNVNGTGSGSFNGTVSAANVSSQQFGLNTGGGNYSFPASLAVNRGTIAGSGAFAVGPGTIAWGNGSAIALGSSTVALGNIAMALGTGIWVTGTSSVGIGLDATTRTLSQPNTLAIMGGKVGIGTLTPTSTLTVAGNITATGDVCTGINANCLSAVLELAGGTAPGRVTFWNTTTTLSSDANFYWDNTNKRLGIGTSSPSVPFELVTSLAGSSGVNPSFKIVNTTQNSAEINFSPASTTNTWNIGASPTNPYFRIWRLSGGSKFLHVMIDSVGQMGIQANAPANTIPTPQSALHVIDPAGVTNYLQVDTLTAAPSSTACDAANEAGRMKYDRTNFDFYVCSGTTGWKKGSGTVTDIQGGQTNYVPLWKSATTLGTSTITDDGTNINFNPGGGAGANVRINSGTFWVTGSTADVPASNIAGSRLMFVPATGAFRAGGLSTANQNYWNSANIGLYSVAMGYDVKAEGNYSVSLGYNNDVKAGNTAGVAIGASNAVNAPNGVAIGGSNSIQANGNYTVLFGGFNSAQASYSLVGGYGNVVGTTADYSAIFGSNNYLQSAGYSLLAGRNSSSTANYTIGVGQNLSISGIGSAVFGNRNKVFGSYSLVGGQDNYVTGLYSFVAGEFNNAGGFHTVALGYSNSVNGDSSITLGQNANVIANNAMHINLDSTMGRSVTIPNTMAITGGRMGIGIVNPVASTTMEVVNSSAAGGGAIRLTQSANANGTRNSGSVDLFTVVSVTTQTPLAACQTISTNAQCLAAWSSAGATSSCSSSSSVSTGARVLCAKFGD